MFIIYSQSWLTKENDCKIRHNTFEEKILPQQLLKETAVSQSFENISTLYKVII